jgi:hypothetical protein
MVMKVKKKNKTLHQILLDEGFTLDNIVRTHSGLTKAVKKYAEQEDYCEIDSFVVVPGSLVKESRPKEYSQEFFRVNSYAIYVKPAP